MPKPQSKGSADAVWGATTIETVAATGERIVAVPEGIDDGAFAAQVMATGLVEYAEPDWRCFPVITTPVDPDFVSQWHHVAIESALAWDRWRGGNGVTLGFVDTGIDLTHPDLADLRLPGFNSATDLEEIAGGDVSAINGHGTAVAGTACAIGNNNAGVCGVNWRTPFVMVRASDEPDGSAFLSDLTEGARWCVDHGARAVSVSYSGVSSASVQTTGAYIKSVGGLLSWAAGNNGSLLNPFDRADVIIVGATNSGDTRAGFSNYGRCIDVVAPGEGIVTTSMGGGTGPISGTSFATPMTNGVIGLIWSINPSLTPAQVESMLFDSCDDLGDAGEDDVYGRGRINARRAVEAALASTGAAFAPLAADDFVPTAFLDTPRTVRVLDNDRDPRTSSLAFAAPAVSAQGGVVETVAAGGSEPQRVVYIPPAGFTGADSFGYVVTNAAGLTATATVFITVLDPANFRPADSPEAISPGLDVEYYAGAFDLLPNFDSLTPFLTDVVPQINFVSTEGVFATSGLADDVAARFQGYLLVPMADRYTLSIESDDGSNVYVGGELLIGNDGLHGMREKFGTIDLLPGPHAMTIDFFERGGGAGLILRWSGSSASRQVVDASNLARGRCPADTDADGDVDSDDIAAFFGGWDSGDGDFDGDDDTDSDDVVGFFSRWEMGC